MDNYSEKLKNRFFARHETFCPRYGWLKKGFDRVAGYNGFERESGIFDADDAIEKLGVGKNMVRSIRFWCMAFKVIGPENESGPLRISGPMRATDFGSNLLSENGWDPYLEDPASLWLLHWKLFTGPVLATAWSLILNLKLMGAFTLDDLTRMILKQRDDIPGFQRYSDSSFRKDASCFIRMYAPPGKQAAEEIECPFNQLELLISGDSSQGYRFNSDEKATLPDAVFLAACFEYAGGMKSISLNRLTYGFNSPGTVFRLSESDVGNRLERSIPALEGVVFTESYGNRQLQFEVEPEVLYWKVLRRYYEGPGL